MLRYLCLLRVNSSLAVLPYPFSVELSKVLCTVISMRLPTREAGKWKKSLIGYDRFESHLKRRVNRRQKNVVLPEVSWPISAAFFLYPGKMIYGTGELIPFELKLFGKDASHEFFIEVFLPALEEAGFNRESEWCYRNCLWGHFDIDSIYVANRNRWDPLVSQGRLDLKYKANSLQYAENLSEKFKEKIPYSYRKMTWLTPFDFTGVFSVTKENVQVDHDEKGTPDATPTLYGLMDAFIVRLHQILEGRRFATENVWNVFSQDERNHLYELMSSICDINVTHTDLLPAKNGLGRWIGHQTFTQIPNSLLPFLELASILHIGCQTHAGCGTFRIAKFPVKHP